MVTDSGLSPVELFGAEVMVVLRKILMHAQSQRGLVTCGRFLRAVRKARRIPVGCACHAKLARLFGHDLGEIRFGTGNECAGGRGDVVGGACHKGKNGIFHPDRLTGAQAQFRWRLIGAALGHGNARIKRYLALFELFEKQVQRHHLGQGGRVAQFVGIARIDDLARMGIHDQRCCLGFGGLSGEGGGGDQQDDRSHGGKSPESTRDAHDTHQRRPGHSPKTPLACT